jgi:DNA ligase-associated metallophosphoesterase
MVKPNILPTHEYRIECLGETLILHCQRAMFRPSTKTLLMSDIHLGKEEVFNRAGMALPSGVSQRNLQRLDELIDRYMPIEIIVLGDLMHAAPTVNDFWPKHMSAWLDCHSKIKIRVVAGNHDRAIDHLDSRIEWTAKPLLAPPFIYSHEPVTSSSNYVISGHLHPTYVLATHIDRIRCPVFWFRESNAILPAFGSFTGGYNIKPNKNDHLYIAGEDEVVALHF